MLRIGTLVPATCQSNGIPNLELVPKQRFPLSGRMDGIERLATAAAKGDTETVRVLLERVDANGVNRFGQTPLQVMMMGSTTVAELLLHRGANPNIRDPHTGATPLHDAARTGFLDTVELLVQFNADPNALDNNRCRPVDLAKDYGHKDVAAFFEHL